MLIPTEPERQTTSHHSSCINPRLSPPHVLNFHVHHTPSSSHPLTTPPLTHVLHIHTHHTHICFHHTTHEMMLAWETSWSRHMMAIAPVGPIIFISMVVLVVCICLVPVCPCVHLCHTPFSTLSLHTLL
eukprot:Blabericola_migrator_1__2967@NODE_1858_length_3652_cov_33_976290_g1188_i0_p1_GENE_NODE_1858_length_3652_cov_33_976290_g1188_i0NODE_1858_length_3652_cov_33_976290_g1188_i0_p1_ORF_typecomplete_len129_score22_48Shisa/PF13908_6/0_023_NODE_1858_length_3652_cov_33_976290_g1188_i015651951